MTDGKEEYPEPRTLRDLWLMRETCPKHYGTVEYERTPGLPSCSRDFEEGMVTCHAMWVDPQLRRGTVTVQVYREVVRDLRGGTYYPLRDVLWERTYQGFEEFRRSPFWDLTMEAWKHRRTRWDTRLMDEHEAVDNGDSRWVWGHYYKHETDWLGNDRLSGEIGSLNVYVDDGGSVSVEIDGERSFDGPIQDLARVLREHGEMTEKLRRLKEHGVDLDEGTLSIRLWGDDDE